VELLAEKGHPGTGPARVATARRQLEVWHGRR